MNAQSIFDPYGDHHNSPSQVLGACVYGYKGFEQSDGGSLKCRSMIYEPGRIYVTGDNVQACSKGFHFCERLKDVFNYYSYKVPGNVFYKVKGWGQISRSEDKVAVSHIEILEKVSEEEMKHAIIAPRIEEFLLLQEKNPNVVLGGSMALILQGWIPAREVGDIDVSLPFYTQLIDATVTNTRGQSGNGEALRMIFNSEKDNFNFDLFLDNKSVWRDFVYAGRVFRIQDPMQIVAAKMKYLIKGKTKHAKDLKHVMGKLENWHINNVSPFTQLS